MLNAPLMMAVPIADCSIRVSVVKWFELKSLCAQLNLVLSAEPEQFYQGSVLIALMVAMPLPVRHKIIISSA